MRSVNIAMSSTPRRLQVHRRVQRSRARTDDSRLTDTSGISMPDSVMRVRSIPELSPRTNSIPSTPSDALYSAPRLMEPAVHVDDLPVV